MESKINNKYCRQELSSLKAQNARTKERKERNEIKIEYQKTKSKIKSKDEPYSASPFSSCSNSVRGATKECSFTLPPRMFY